MGKLTNISVTAPITYTNEISKLMDISAVLKVLMKVSLVFPDHTKGSFPFTSHLHIENRRFLLLKERPGENSFKTLKSSCLLSILYIPKPLYGNSYKALQNTDSLLKTLLAQSPKKLMMLRNKGDMLAGNFLHSKPKKRMREVFLELESFRVPEILELISKGQA